jgi:hypothetical protein
MLQERAERGKQFEQNQQKLEQSRIADKAEILETLRQNQQKLEKLKKHFQEIQDQIKVQVVEINKVREECHKKYEQLEKRFSAEIAAEIRQVRSNISSVEEIREKELIERKGQMRADNKRHDETGLRIQRQVSENRERIDKSECTIVEVTHELANLNLSMQQVNIRVEKEAEDNQRRQRERDATFEQQIKPSQAKAEELNQIEKEVVSLEQDLSTPVELQGSGTQMLARQSDKDGFSNEQINTQLEVKEKLFRKVIQKLPTERPNKESLLHKILKVWGKMKSRAEVRKARSKQNRGEKKPQIGDQALVKGQQVSGVSQNIIATFQRHYIGPFCIQQTINPYRNEIKDKGGTLKGLHHVSHLMTSISQCIEPHRSKHLRGI